MKMVGGIAIGEFRRNSPGKKTGHTSNSWQIASVTETTAKLTASIVNLFLEEGTGLYGPKHQRITPLAAKALRWMGGPAGSLRLSGRARSGAAGAGAGYIFAKSTRGMPPRPFFQKSIDTTAKLVGSKVIITIWNEAA